MAVKEYVVIGLGNFGAKVASELHKMKCRVTAIDTDKAKVQMAQEYSSTAIVADASERKFLENIEVQRFDCFVVSTGVDSHASILITLHLKELGAKTIVVKANSDDHARILLKVGATDAIIPEEQMAIRVAHSLARANLLDFLPLAADFGVAEFVPPKNFYGKTFLDLKLRTKHNIQVVAVKDSHTGHLEFVPGGDYRVKESDILVVLGHTRDIEQLKE